MKLSSLISAAALVAACAIANPPQVEAGSLNIMGTPVRNTHELSRKAGFGSRRRAHAHGARLASLDDEDAQLRRRNKTRRSCKAKKNGAHKPKGRQPGSNNGGGDGSGGDTSDDGQTEDVDAPPTTNAVHGSGHGHGHGSGHGHSGSGNQTGGGHSGGSGNRTSCFPALNHHMPSSVPQSTDGWWCDPKDEVAFLGFSYGVTGCQDANTMRKDFKQMRDKYKSRYVRPYGGCDKKGFYNDMVNAAWDSGVGIYPLIWFGFDGGDQWKQRRDDIVNTIKSNPKAPYVVRGVVLGSEPLFDHVLPGDGMVKELKSLSNSLKPHTGSGPSAMQVTISEMPYAFTIDSAAKSLFSTMDVIQANVLPFFDQAASTAAKSVTNVKWNLDYLKKNGQGKKIIFSQTGWPSNKDTWPGNNAGVVASVAQEKAYFEMLDQNACGFLKDAPEGGVGYFFAHWDESAAGGWGLLDNSGKPKFDYSPRTSCD